MSENNQPEGKEPEGKEQEPEQSFTQADVDRIVADRLKRERETTKARYAAYDDLKTKAGEKASLEERVAEIERQARESESRALRAEVANAKGLTPNQAKRLIGATREELEADAYDLLKDISAQKKQNNVSPREGNNPKPERNGDEREFVRGLFARANTD